MYSVTFAGNHSQEHTLVTIYTTCTCTCMFIMVERKSVHGVFTKFGHYIHVNNLRPMLLALKQSLVYLIVIIHVCTCMNPMTFMLYM